MWGGGGVSRREVEWRVARDEGRGTRDEGRAGDCSAAGRYSVHNNTSCTSYYVLSYAYHIVIIILCIYELVVYTRSVIFKLREYERCNICIRERIMYEKLKVSVVNARAFSE